MIEKPSSGSVRLSMADASAPAVPNPPRTTTLEMLRQHSVRAALDPESLLRIPLVIPMTEFPERLVKRLAWLADQRDVSLVLDLLGRLPRRGPLPGEPRDLFIPN